MRKMNRMACFFAGGLAGCSLHPIPDDVSPYSTEQIVRYGRCEMRSEVIRYIAYTFRDQIAIGPAGEGIQELMAATADRVKKHKSLSPEEKKLLRLAKVAVVYSFDFNITETNKTSADAGFRLPWPVTNVVDAGATAGLDLTRQGQRVFGTEDTWGPLITNPVLCSEPYHRSGNFVYPLTGSIGVARVVETFIDIEEQGGAKDNFVDTLTFTTMASGGADASLKLDPVPNQFRLVSATAGANASRQDVHKLTLSLAFPQPDPPPSGGTSKIARVDGDLNAPFTRPAPWRARYNLCVQDARNRENTFKILRLEAPEVYCIRYADAFAPSRPAAAEALRVEVQAPASGIPNISPVPNGLNNLIAPGGASGLPPAVDRRSTPTPSPSPRNLAPQRAIRPDAPL